MSRHFARVAAGLAAIFLIAGCSTLTSYMHSTFNQTVDPRTSDHVHASVPIGTTMVAAEATLSSQGYNCDTRTGNFTDELGRDRSAPRFLSCVQRAGKVSFACENRDQVVVVPSGGVVDEVNVVRGPDCDQQPGPALTPPNAN
jgi:hypothetical protein